MTQVGTVFSELLKLVPRYHFDKAVNGYIRRPIRQVIHDLETVHHAIVLPDYPQRQPAGNRDGSDRSIEPLLSPGVDPCSPLHVGGREQPPGLSDLRGVILLFTGTL